MNSSGIIPKQRRYDRRSQRVILRLPVVVRSQSKGNGALVEKTHTIVVNEHGALIALNMEVHLTDMLSIENPTTGKQLFCKVVHKERQLGDSYKIGIEFSEPTAYFWNVCFPEQPVQ